MKTMIMVLTMLPSVCLMVSVILYCKFQSNYKKLVRGFLGKYTIPSHYLLYSHMGFFGFPLMAYFFINLSENKKIFFLEKNSPAYNFPLKDDNMKLIRTMKPIIFIMLFGFFCCFLLGVIAFLIKIHLI